MRQARNFRGYMKKCLGPFVGGLAGFLWGERIAGEWAVAWSWGERVKDNQHQRGLFPTVELKLWAYMGLKRLGD